MKMKIIEAIEIIRDKVIPLMELNEELSDELEAVEALELSIKALEVINDINERRK